MFLNSLLLVYNAFDYVADLFKLYVETIATSQSSSRRDVREKHLSVPGRKGHKESFRDHSVLEGRWCAVRGSEESSV